MLDQEVIENLNKLKNIVSMSYMDTTQIILTYNESIKAIKKIEKLRELYNTNRRKNALSDSELLEKIKEELFSI